MNDNLLLIKWINNATYSQLLERWRHAPSGDHMFIGEVGDHYANVMAEKKRLLSNDMQVKISKEIGWT